MGTAMARSADSNRERLRTIFREIDVKRGVVSQLGRMHREQAAALESLEREKRALLDEARRAGAPFPAYEAEQVRPDDDDSQVGPE